MKITDDKKYFIFENQFDKIPAVIIDYIYCFVDNFVPNNKHKTFITNDLLCFINSSKVLNKCFNNVRFLLKNIIIIDNIQKYNYLLITNENNLLEIFEKKEYIKNNTVLIFDNIHNYTFFLRDILTRYIISFCNKIQDYSTILQKYYYLKKNDNMMKKTTIKKLNELLKEGQNIAIFQMLNYSKLIDYLCKYKNFVIKECLNKNHIIIINENYELFLITNNNKPYY
jgi:hypothetical protein